MAIPNIYKTTEENLMAGILMALGGSIVNVGNDQFSTKNDLLLAILIAIENGGSGGGGFTLLSQFQTAFSLAVLEDTDELGNPLGTGSLTITKI